MESKEIPCAVVDVAASAEDKAKMREIANDPACLPPQIAFGESYCGVSILDYYCKETCVWNFSSNGYNCIKFHAISELFFKLNLLTKPLQCLSPLSGL